MQAGVSNELASVEKGLYEPIASILWTESAAISWKTRLQRAHEWKQRQAWVLIFPSNEQITHNAAFLQVLQLHGSSKSRTCCFARDRDHTAVVCLVIPVAGAAKPVKGVLGVTGPSASNVAQRSFACAVLALLSALSLALQAANGSKV